MTDTVTSDNNSSEMTIIQNGNDHSSLDEPDSESTPPPNQLIDFLPSLEDYTPTVSFCLLDRLLSNNFILYCLILRSFSITGLKST